MFGNRFLKLLDSILTTGGSGHLRPTSERKQTQRFQVVKICRREKSAVLLGSFTLTPYEAMVGAHKLITVPWGLQNRLYRVVVPQDIANGQLLRLKGVGKPRSDGSRGDMMLKITIQHI